MNSATVLRLIVLGLAVVSTLGAVVVGGPWYPAAALSFLIGYLLLLARAEMKVRGWHQ